MAIAATRQRRRTRRYSSISVALLPPSEIESREKGFMGRLAGVYVFLVPCILSRILDKQWARSPGPARLCHAVRAGDPHRRDEWLRLAFQLGFVGLLYNPLLIFLAIFVYLGATAEAQDTQLRDVAAGIPARDAMVTSFVALPESATIADAASTLLATMQHGFPVADARGGQKGLVTRGDIIRANREKSPDASVPESMRTDIPIISDRSFVEGAFRLMREAARRSSP